MNFVRAFVKLSNSWPSFLSRLFEMAKTAAPTEGAAAPGVTNQAPAPGVTNQSSPPEETPIIPPEIRAIRTPADAMEVTTLLTESEALVGALQELSASMQGEEGGKLVKARYLSLKAQLAMMKVVSAENRQVGDKNVEALDQVVRELGNQRFSRACTQSRGWKPRKVRIGTIE